MLRAFEKISAGRLGLGTAGDRPAAGAPTGLATGQRDDQLGLIEELAERLRQSPEALREVAALDHAVELLSEEGYDVTHVSEPEEARQRAAAEAWDLLLIDGFSKSHRELQAEDVAFLQHLAAFAPVVVLTARAWASQVQPDDLGVAAIVQKPYEIDHLLGVIRSVLGR